MKTYSFAIMVVALLCSLAQAHVIGFDLGSTFFKVTLVKPGSPFTIVENLTSKRKTDTMMTIANDVRLWSSDSFNANPKLPKTTFANVASFLGQEYEQTLLD